jgi:hypothetical protein
LFNIDFADSEFDSTHFDDVTFAEPHPLVLGNLLNGPDNQPNFACLVEEFCMQTHTPALKILKLMNTS